jgi:hypothetical protein
MSKLDKQNQYRLILNWIKENWDELEFRRKLKHMDDYKSFRQNKLATYKTSNLTVENGSWRGRKYTHILP